MATAFETWLCSRLNELSIDSEVYGEYVTGIVADKETDLEERCSTAVDVLRAVVEDETSLDTLAGEIQAQWIAQEQELEKLKIQELEEEKVRLQAEKQEELKLVELNEQKEAEKAQARLHMSKEEIYQREKLLREYGAVGDSEFDEDGNVIFKGQKSTEDVTVVNTNRTQGKIAQQEMREKMKKEHEAKVKREKELLEADRLRKDKAKKRTQKREKQRGAG
ncbi:unnamed protein product [Aphanomyces euteiches]|uniref:CCDC43 PWI-like domain-containing protein n=1 Tax=Aphanomyces euteiches TaxID=100861 RepID=A0A6G0XXU5_9STRA|nr:hypothetical protein Ae201684_000451 [Aphanomyces euteiches]KAH9145992.1 hypothetical protein AeRB84_010104 [Aphanomyces euteiches]